MILPRILSRTLSSALVGIAVVLAASSISAAPKGSWSGTWQSIYPGSQSGPNASCQLCHVSPGGGKNYNGYGKKIYDLMNGGSSVTNAIIGSAGFNSDGDPLGTTSIDEINANTQPGWTAGPNNTHYNNSGVTATNQTPPGGIFGMMDLCEGQGTETVRVGTPPNPNAFMPGVTSNPVIGGTWDPVINHSSFMPGAFLDLMLISGTPISIPLAPFGTLLCLPPFYVDPIASGPGVPFAIPFPLNCNFVGLSLCTQGVSLDAGGSVLLTNALDIVLGTY